MRTLLWVLVALAFGFLRYGARYRNREVDPLSPRRQASPRNLPYTFLVLAILLGFMAVVVMLGRTAYMASEDDLKPVAGTVHELPSLTGRGGRIDIRVQTDSGLQHIYVDDFSHYGKIIRLRPGDQITARVHNFVGDAVVWELQRDGVTIESYLDMSAYSARELQRATTNALWIGLVASILMTAAIILRMYFGAWRIPRSAVSSESATAAFTGEPATSNSPEATPWRLT